MLGSGITPGMRRLLAPLVVPSLVLVTALVTAVALLTPPGTSSPSPAQARDERPVRAGGLEDYRHLAAQVFGTVAVGMPNPRTVLLQHYDATTQDWGPPTVLFSAGRRVTCGAIEGRATSATGSGVALLLACDTPYSEDQAPVHSVALVSPDGQSWSCLLYTSPSPRD